MSTKDTRWQDLSPATRRAVILGGVVQVMLLVLANRDISRRPAAGIRGSKGAWRLATLVNFVGPLVYFSFGRRK